MSRAAAYFANGLGNFVLMMPALQALREVTGEPVDLVLPGSWRDSRRGPVEEIAAAWDVIGRVISHPEEPIEFGAYQHWFWSPHNSNTDTVLEFKARMRHIPVPKPQWRNAGIHERDHYMDIVRAMGWRGSAIPAVDFPLTEEPALDLPRPIVGLCNGAFATAAWEKKHWPHFAELARTLKGYFGGSVIGIGGPGELDGVRLDIDFCGKLPILSTARAIQQCDLFVSTDTGCMHIADTIGVPTIALFGSTLISKNGPTGERSSAVASCLECAPCQETALFFACSISECMRSISVGDVMAQARRMLR
jgi:ADP-heptose:LPS heptosyltransferase